jgi:hypothetical protein
MKSPAKIGKAFYGLMLALWKTKTLSMDVFKGKRVAIVGPASSAFNTALGNYIDGFDIVVRVNKSAYVVQSGKFSNDIGTRTDILYHSFFENSESGGGILDWGMYQKQGVRYLLNPRNTLGGLRNTFNFYKKYLNPVTTYTLPKHLYKRICAPLHGYRPTVGCTALSSIILEADFKELYITGFTFYRTPFGAGYRDQMQSPEKAKAFIHEQGIHNIDHEFAAFKEMISNTSKNIRMDAVLKEIIQT